MYYDISDKVTSRQTSYIIILHYISNIMICIEVYDTDTRAHVVAQGANTLLFPNSNNKTPHPN